MFLCHRDMRGHAVGELYRCVLKIKTKAEMGVVSCNDVVITAEWSRVGA